MPVTQVAPSLHESVHVDTGHRRLLSIDVYRGLTVAGMILVTNPANYAHVYPQLLHSLWNGVTLTDMIAPSFLFVVGISLSFSFAGRIRRGSSRIQLASHTLQRCCALMLLGLILNAFPDFSLHYLRIPGILQHIAVCLAIGGLLHCFSGRRTNSGGFRANTFVLVTASVALIAADWILMRVVPVPGYGAGHLDPFGNMGGFVDRWLFGTNHLWPWGNFWWDPDGMVSTLTASTNLILGILAGDLLRSSSTRSRKLLAFLVAGALLALAGIALNPIYPINKKIWTPSYTLLADGFCLVALALLHWLLDGERRSQFLEKLTLPARIFGSNAILAFGFTTIANSLAPRIFLSILSRERVNLPAFAYDTFARFLAPNNASLLYALLFVFLNLLLVWPFSRKGIFLKL